MQLDMFKPSSKTFFTSSSFADPLCCLCFMSVMLSSVFCPSSLVVICWERAYLLARLYVLLRTNIGTKTFFVLIMEGIDSLLLFKYGLSQNNREVMATFSHSAAIFLWNGS